MNAVLFINLQNGNLVYEKKIKKQYCFGNGSLNVMNLASLIFALYNFAGDVGVAEKENEMKRHFSLRKCILGKESLYFGEATTVNGSLLVVLFTTCDLLEEISLCVLAKMVNRCSLFDANAVKQSNIRKACKELVHDAIKDNMQLEMNRFFSTCGKDIIRIILIWGNNFHVLCSEIERQHALPVNLNSSCNPWLYFRKRRVMTGGIVEDICAKISRFGVHQKVFYPNQNGAQLTNDQMVEETNAIFKLSKQSTPLSYNYSIDQDGALLYLRCSTFAISAIRNTTPWDACMIPALVKSVLRVVELQKQ